MTRFRALALLLLVLGSSGCDALLGEDKRPRFITYRVTGEVGQPVRIVLSTLFSAGNDEAGVTRVQLGFSDTLDVSLPWDTVVDVRVDRRFFAELSVAEPDTALTRIVADVDGRSLLNESRDVAYDDPFRLIYLFNQATTTSQIEVF